MSERLLPFSLEAQHCKLGMYEHYRGMRYQVIAVARHSETLEEYVVYRALYGDQEVWIRPLTMFLSEVEIEGKWVPRFKLVP